MATLTNRHGAPVRRWNIITCDATTSYICFPCNQRNECETICCPFPHHKFSNEDLVKDVLGVPVLDIPGKDREGVTGLSALPVSPFLITYSSSYNVDEKQPEHKRTYTSSFVNISKSQQFPVSKGVCTSNNRTVRLSADIRLSKPCPCMPENQIIPGPKCTDNVNTTTSDSLTFKIPNISAIDRENYNGAVGLELSSRRQQNLTTQIQEDLEEIRTKLTTLILEHGSLATNIERGQAKLKKNKKRIYTRQDKHIGNYGKVNKLRLKTAGVPGDWPLVGVYSIDTYGFGCESLKPSNNPSSSVTFGDVFEGLTKETFLYGCYSTQSLSDYFKSCPYGCTMPKIKERDPNSDWDESIDGPKYCDFGCPRAEEYWIPPRCIRCAQEMFEEQQAQLLLEKDKRAAEKAAQKEKEKRAAAEAEKRAHEAEIEAEKAAAAAALEKKLGPLKAASEKKAAEAQKKAEAEKAAKEKRAAADKAAEAKRAAAERAAEEKEEAKEKAALEKKIAAEKAAREKQKAADEKKKLQAKLAAEKKLKQEREAKEKKARQEKEAAEKKQRQAKEAKEKKEFEEKIKARKAVAAEVKAAAEKRAAEAAAERAAADKKEEEERNAEQALAKTCCICKEMEGKGIENMGDLKNLSTPPCKCKTDPPDQRQYNQGDDNKRGSGRGRTGPGSAGRTSDDFDEDEEEPAYVVRKWADELDSVAFDRNQKKPCVPKNCQCDIPWCSGQYKTEYTISLDRPAPPCGDPDDAGVKQLSCSDECKFQNVCSKFHATMASDMARMRSGFTVNVKTRACTTCDTTKICKEDLCSKGKVKKHVCECPGGVSGFRLAQPCQSRPCPRRNTFLKKKKK